jgi:hypothetical protein
LLTLCSGGDCQKDTGGNLQLKHDQSPDGKIIRSIMASLEEQKPVGIVIGKPLFSS